MIWFHFLTYGKVCPQECPSQRPQGSSPTFHMVLVCLPSIWPISLWSPQGWKQGFVAFAFVAWHPEIFHKCLGVEWNVTKWLELNEKEKKLHMYWKKKLISFWGNKRYQRNSRKQKKKKRIKREEMLKNTREITSEAVTFRRIKGVGLLQNSGNPTTTTITFPPTPTPPHTHTEWRMVGQQQRQATLTWRQTATARGLERLILHYLGNLAVKYCSFSTSV